jgi:hypothetical protein
MKREILFRGKRVDNDKWIEGYYWKDHNGKHCITYLGDDNFFNAEVIPETVEQLLFEFNNNKFFSGDIIGNDRSNIRYAILWNEESRCFSIFNNWEIERINGDDELFKINILANKESVRVSFLKKYELYPVGNIHDNPELIN